MQASQFHDSTVKAPSPLGRSNPPHSLKVPTTWTIYFIQCDSRCKWKINLVLTEPSRQQQHQPTKPSSTSLLSSPLKAYKIEDAADRPLISALQPKSAYSLSVSANTQYPWDYVAPYHDNWNHEFNDDRDQQLREALERNQYLESIIRSQADQIGQSRELPPDVNNVVETMKQVYLMSENEQRLRYNTETKMLHKDIQTLTKRLQKTTQLLHSMESLELSAKDASVDKTELLEDKKRLQQKLHLGQLRLKARDAEIEFLRLKQHQEDQPNNPLPPSSPRFKDTTHKTRPYLFQQQYSPKLRSDIQPNTISGLDSLGMLADQMLSDPDFESQHASDTERSRYTANTPPPPSRRNKLRKRPLNNLKEEEPDPTIYYYNRPAYGSSNAPAYYYNTNEKRSKRSIDSANTLLSMFPSKSPPLAPISDQDMDRSPASYNRQQKPKSKLAYVRWTPDEDQLLRSSVFKNGTGNWDKVAQMVPDRSSQQCRQRWSKYLDQKHGPPHQQHQAASSSKDNNDARHSPSIASLLNKDGPEPDDTRMTSTSPLQQHSPNVAPNTSSHPVSSFGYHPPSPISTPKNWTRDAGGFNRT
ncbi:unnamed protein product [Absidia cylindrospora]